MAKAKAIPVHPEGFKFKGGAGQFKVWHAGYMDYRVTDESTGAEVSKKQQFGNAWTAACQMYDAARLGLRV
ncbi:hypothetical protein AB4Y36_10195 [Paraburkholderia sp. BR10936]|uniref:hypothetical protein n=1 Tax=Paraburkholderia sp. BR10936 TaxID=3236993 RepID=UPI0034D2DE67